MTPAGLDTRRRMLGLSIDEYAALCQVQDKTVRRWLRGDKDVPADAITRLEDLEWAMEHHVKRIVELATDRVDEGPVPLTRYRTEDELDAGPHDGLPLGAHAMMIAWAEDALAAEGVDTIVQWADGGGYRAGIIGSRHT